MAQSHCGTVSSGRLTDLGHIPSLDTAVLRQTDHQRRVGVLPVHSTTTQHLSRGDILLVSSKSLHLIMTSSVSLKRALAFMYAHQHTENKQPKLLHFELALTMDNLASKSSKSTVMHRLVSIPRGLMKQSYLIVPAPHLDWSPSLEAS